MPKKSKENTEDVNHIFKAITLIQEQIGLDHKVSGVIGCPKCGKQLSYTMHPNKHIWGRCSTENCLSWMM